MNHGTATLKKDLAKEGEILRKEGETGVLTAYLPEQDIVAVMFDGMMGPRNWFMIDVETFEEYFDFTLNEAQK